MLSQTVRKWWGPLDGVQNYVADSIPQGARVLEIGPGIAPFRRATHLFDREFYWDVLPEGILRENIYTGDAEGSLPFPDKYFDFVYCRHVVEDLNNPFTLLKEMSRIGKAGYVETPSVMVEMCRGVDGKGAPWRGYHHDNWFVGNSSGKLIFVRKFPTVEYLLDFDEDKYESVISNYQLYWNTYFMWDGRIDFEYINLNPTSVEYLNSITDLATNGLRSANDFNHRLSAVHA
ncbi:MAG TPA: methyltransferase domain-containing protein [Candidatus Sulfotelmatobacter sp.]|nr:methyltransferase domain-containing protein [Candidatus Sulfotelmatobacter sp.]